MLKVNASASAAPNVQAPAAPQRRDAGDAPAAPSEPAAIFDISARGRELAALQIRILDEPLISEEEAFQMKADFGKSLLDPSSHKQIHTVSGEGTVRRLVQDVVNYKTDPTTARLITDELDRLITGIYVNGKTDGTIEERAVNREKGLKLAEYIAETYIDEPSERKNFLDGVKHFYDSAVLVDKGYIITEKPDGGRTVTKPWETSPYHSATGAAINAFAANERNVGNIITQAQNTLDKEAVSADIRRIIDDIIASHAKGLLTLGDKWYYPIKYPVAQ
jgi:hypothetical protein